MSSCDDRASVLQSEHGGAVVFKYQVIIAVDFDGPVVGGVELQIFSYLDIAGAVWRNNDIAICVSA